MTISYLNLQSVRTAVNNLTQIGAQLAISNYRLTTGKRVNFASDDPSGIIALSALQAQIAQIDAATTNGQRISSLADSADGALSEISTLIDTIETNVIAASGDGVSEEDKATYQANIDSAINAIDRLVNTTSFNGQHLLNGSIGYTASGVDSDKISDVKIHTAETNGGSVSVTVSLSAPAEATLVSAPMPAPLGDGENVVFTITGPDGSHEYTFNNTPGKSRSQFASAVNLFSGETGVTAADINGGITFSTTDTGSDATISITITDGTTFRLTGGATSGSDTGSDVEVTVDGVSAAIDGTNQEVFFSTPTVSGSFSLTDAFYGGADDTSGFTVSGDGGDFTLGTSSYDTIYFGQASLSSTGLGNAKLGYLSSIKSGGANDVASGNFSTAQSITDKASDQVASARARFGSLKTYTIESTLDSLAATKTALNDAIDDIEELDYVAETANNERLQALYTLGISVISAINTNNSNVLSLFENLL